MAESHRCCSCHVGAEGDRSTPGSALLSFAYGLPSVLLSATKIGGGSEATGRGHRRRELCRSLRAAHKPDRGEIRVPTDRVAVRRCAARGSAPAGPYPGRGGSRRSYIERRHSRDPASRPLAGVALLRPVVPGAAAGSPERSKRRRSCPCEEGSSALLRRPGGGNLPAMTGELPQWLLGAGALALVALRPGEDSRRNASEAGRHAAPGESDVAVHPASSRRAQCCGARAERFRDAGTAAPAADLSLFRGG